MNEQIYIKSILNIRIKILKIGWLYICQKHRDLENQFDLLENCLKDTDEIWESKQNTEVYLYYKKINQKYICAVCKHYNGDGFLITAYLTYKLQGKKKIWSK